MRLMNDGSLMVKGEAATSLPNGFMQGKATSVTLIMDFNLQNLIWHFDGVHKRTISMGACGLGESTWPLYAAMCSGEKDVPVSMEVEEKPSASSSSSSSSSSGVTSLGFRSAAGDTTLIKHSFSSSIIGPTEGNTTLLNCPTPVSIIGGIVYPANITSRPALNRNEWVIGHPKWTYTNNSQSICRTESDGYILFSCSQLVFILLIKKCCKCVDGVYYAHGQVRWPLYFSLMVFAPLPKSVIGYIGGRHAISFTSSSQFAPNCHLGIVPATFANWVGTIGTSTDGSGFRLEGGDGDVRSGGTSLAMLGQMGGRVTTVTLILDFDLYQIQILYDAATKATFSFDQLRLPKTAPLYPVYCAGSANVVITMNAKLDGSDIPGSDSSGSSGSGVPSSSGDKLLWDLDEDWKVESQGVYRVDSSKYVSHVPIPRHFLSVPLPSR
jgi:hypothetical protein